MKETYGLQCFEFDLDDTWVLLEETEFDATSDTFAFHNQDLDVRLFIYGARIDATGRDLLELATGMNGAVLSSLRKTVGELGGSLLVDERMWIGDTETGFEVDVIAEAAGPPGVQQRMLVVAMINSVVAIYVRLESPTLMGDDLRTLWRNLRPGLFLAEPFPSEA
ncbi:MAG TPA: hypothetical protein VEA80_15690 [Vitreimonas sp.]|uniref:hypothetical protein n=1 Tax=Vitreimonas sp. TaxID=3069702 RepID=UPI002D2D9670|nr:hypothetical protein [Vitreimonas sp.]HYD88917.1 hypothetical protein [Vitreimonas sp.]